jgi:DNA (cytosine-5)-methyltransferase 1
MPSCFSLFSGGGLADLGLHAAGCQSIGGIDNDPAAVEVAQANGLPVVCQDILAANPCQFERPDLLWASPPCVTASIANQRTGETELDRELARAVVRFVEAMLPPVVVLENVAGYRQYDSYGYIVAALRLHHYHVCDWLLNAADYGAPQQRRRLIMIAQRHAIPQRPSATHKRHADMFSPQWRGWYDAVADLAPTLPQAQLANWQRRRLPAWVTETVLLSNQATERTDGLMTAHEPALSITEQHNGRLRALLLDDQFSSAGGLDGNGRGATTAPGEQPGFTVTTRDSRKIKAVLLDHADVRSLTPRALARLQSMPDSYVLPDARRLACSIIGRGVPCVLAQRIGEHVKGVIV